MLRHRSRNHVCVLLSQRRWACTIWQHHVRQANRAREHIRPAPHGGKCSPCHNKIHSTVPNTDTTKIYSSISRNSEMREREYSRAGIAVYQFLFYNQITPRIWAVLEKAGHPAFQESPYHLWNPKLYYHVHRRDITGPYHIRNPHEANPNIHPTLSWRDLIVLKWLWYRPQYSEISWPVDWVTGTTVSEQFAASIFRVLRSWNVIYVVESLHVSEAEFCTHFSLISPMAISLSLSAFAIWHPSFRQLYLLTWTQ
jgi:hypothetical protein